MNGDAELILKALIENIDDDDGSGFFEGVSKEQLRQRTGLSTDKIRKVVKDLYEEGCVTVSCFSGKSPSDFSNVSISADGVKKYAKLLAISEAETQRELIFKQLLHPTIIESSYGLLLNGHLKEAVLSAITVVFDSVKEKAGLSDDKKSLATFVFSAENPKLRLGDLSTDTGKNIQLGFMNILNGAHQAIRNPLAHTTRFNLDEDKARQVLVFASLLARYVDESVVVNQ
jgi:uncharacterized protein (TIGR02391 family)